MIIINETFVKFSLVQIGVKSSKKLFSRYGRILITLISK